MIEVLKFAAYGAAAGSILALLALGVIVVNRVSRVMNFSSAAIAVSAAYLYSDVQDIMPAPIALVIAIFSGLAIGGIVEIVVMRPLKNTSTLTRAIATIGVLLVLQSILNIRYGFQPAIVPAWLPDENVEFVGITVGLDRVLTILIVFILTMVMWIVYKKSSLGLASTALSSSPRSLAALGTWNPATVSFLNWVIAGTLAGIAGVLLAPVISLTPVLALTLVVPILSVALIGNLQSFWLTFIGGLAIGIAQAELSRFVPGVPGIQDAVPFLIVIILLAIRGSSLPNRGESAERLPVIASGRIPWIPMGIVVAIVGVLIWVVPSEWSTAITVNATSAIVLISLVVVTGYAGQLSLASFALAGVAALVAGTLTARLGWDFVPAAVVAVLATIPVGLIIGLPAVRTRGTSLAVVTLGLAVTFQSMVLNNPFIGGGLAGLPLGEPTFFGIPMDFTNHPRTFSTLALITLVLVGVLVLNLRRSGAGRRLVAVRGNEAASASVGISVVRTKLYAFVLSGVIAGIGGVLIAFMQTVLRLDDSGSGGRFGPNAAISGIAQATTGGVGWVGGSIGGTFLQTNAVGFKVLELFSNGSWLTLIAGVLMLVTLVQAPAGIAAMVARDLNKLFSKIPGVSERRERSKYDLTELKLDNKKLNVEPATLHVSGLEVSFGRNRVLKDVGFTLNPGEVVGVIGPNGAGKTTLIEAITGYNIPQAGSVRLDGLELMGKTPTKRAKLGLARSFQSLELFEDLSVMDNLLVASEPTSFWRTLFAGVLTKPAQLSDAAKAAVLAFGLENRLADKPSDLSYGERRLLAIARALARSPRVLLLDEPAAGLGPTERTELRELVRKIADDWGIAVLIIEHDVDLLMRVSDYIVALDFGEVIAAGAPAEVRNNPQVIAAYLGTSEESIPEGAGLNTSFVAVTKASSERKGK